LDSKTGLHSAEGSGEGRKTEEEVKEKVGENGVSVPTSQRGKGGKSFTVKVLQHTAATACLLAALAVQFSMKGADGDSIKETDVQSGGVLFPPLSVSFVARALAMSGVIVTLLYVSGTFLD